MDILYLNAGVALPPVDQLTAQGFDLTFGTNVIGHFLFLKLLYPVLKASSTPTSPSRVVWTSSLTHFFWPPPIQYETLKDTPERRKLDMKALYCESKFATVLLVNYLAKIGADDGIVAVAVDPGNIWTDIQRHEQPSFMMKLVVRFMISFLSLPLYQ